MAVLLHVCSRKSIIGIERQDIRCCHEVYSMLSFLFLVKNFSAAGVGLL